MAANLLANSGSANSTANGNTTIVPTLSPVSTAGNLLICMVTIVGTGTPTVTSVTDTQSGVWVLLNAVALSTTLNVSIWAQTNCKVTVGAVTANLGGTVQGVSSTVLEFSGCGTGQTTEFASGVSASGSTAVTIPIKACPQSQELNLLAIGYTAPTTLLTTATRSGDWQPVSGSISDSVSTGGTNNSEMRTYWASNGYDTPTLTGTLGASSSWISNYVRLIIPGTQGMTSTLAGGPQGAYIPQFYQGTIGG